MKTSKNKILTLIAVFLLFLAILFIPFTTFAQSATKISPFKFEINVNPGEIKADFVKIYNESNEDLMFALSVEDFYAKDEFGRPGFASETGEGTGSGTALYTTSQWISFDQSSIIVPKGSSQTVQFTINVPQNAEPGGHYATIFFTPETPGMENTSVSVKSKIGSLVLLNVGGEVKKDSVLDKFGIYPEDVDFAANKSTGTLGLFESMDIPFAVRIQNKGTVHTRPEGKIEIYDITGAKLKNVGIERIVSPEGVIIDKKMVDYIPVNPDKGVVLPNSYRTYRGLKWDGFAYEFINRETGKVELVKDKPWNVFGYFRAVLTLTLDGKEITKEVSFWIIPWKMILIGLIILALAIFGVIKWRKFSQKRMKEMLRREMEKEKSHTTHHKKKTDEQE